MTSRHRLHDPRGLPTLGRLWCGRAGAERTTRLSPFRWAIPGRWIAKTDRRLRRRSWQPAAHLRAKDYQERRARIGGAAGTLRPQPDLAAAWSAPRRPASMSREGRMGRRGSCSDPVSSAPLRHTIGLTPGSRGPGQRKPARRGWTRPPCARSTVGGQCNGRSCTMPTQYQVAIFSAA